jgi:dienelactone hydrolase
MVDCELNGGEALSLANGTRLGPYEILAPLGAGGMGEVYRAKDTRLGREVAIKVLPEEFAQDPERLRRFEQEARAAAALNHPNILVLYDIGTPEGAPYIVTELLEGQTLRQKLRGGPLPPAKAVEFGIQIAQGLAAAHGKGIVHRDIKPENLFVTHDGRAKILDFGLARLRATEPAATPGTEAPTVGAPTREGTILGTPAYMSPEQAEGKRADARTDLFSFGAVLYEMLTGRRAFDGDSPASILSAILTKTPPAAGTLRPGVPSDLDKILARCLEKDPERRYPSSDVLRKDLAACQDALTQRGITLQALLRNPRFAIPAAFLLVAAVAGATWFGIRSSRQRTARNQWVLEIQRLAEAHDDWRAFLLARKAEAVLGDDPFLARALQDATRSAVWDVRPEGAEMYARPVRGGEDSWVRLGRGGKTPLQYPRGFTVYKLQHPQCETLVMAEADATAQAADRKFELVPRGTQPPGMHRIAAKWPMLFLHYMGFEKPSKVLTDPFWMDVHEVTNREFKAFVDAGGYRKRDLWKHPFVKEGRTLSWEEAIGLFKDATGRSGPAGWELSSYPEGQADYPVTGVSWHEAAAYAEFVGKRLPTVRHWDAALDMDNVGFFVPASNFSGRLAPVGSNPGALNRYGLYDMAGNAREWCFNTTGNQRFTLGEAANGSVHFFSALAPRPPFDRDPGNGFRCIKTMGAPVPEEFDRPIPAVPARPATLPEPYTDAEWKTWLSFLSYQKTPLDARTEVVDDTSPYWRLEKVSFTAAYGGEQMQAYFFMPKSAQPPYQVVIFWPGGSPVYMTSSENGRDLPYGSYFDYVVKDGRAVLYPVIKGTFERGGTAGGNVVEIVSRWFGSNDMLAMQAKDISRSIDYLQSRPDIAGDRIGILAFSWGSVMSLLPCASDDRIKAGALVGASLLFPGVANWARRVSIPIQMDNGRFDYGSVEEYQVPLFKALATPPDKKRHLIWNSDHGISGFEKEVISKNLEWYDKYLGPVRK